MAGVVAGILMLGALVAFLAFANQSWVPVYVANKEASHANDLTGSLQAWADASEDHVARSLTARTWSRAIPIGVRGLPLLGTGGSSGEVSVVNGPTLALSVGGTNVLSASGALAVATHTTRYPPQNHTYALGAMQVTQSDGAWVDLRSLLSASRTTSGQISLTVQALTLTGATQSVGGNGRADAVGSLTSATTATNAAGHVRFLVTGVSADAWRNAFDRALGANALTRQNAADCTTVTTANYCFDTDTNTGTTVDVYVLNVASGWRSSLGTIAVQVRD